MGEKSNSTKENLEILNLLLVFIKYVLQIIKELLK